MRRIVKNILPNRTYPLPVLRGPFRGAVLQLNPRHSIRQILGLYEHELNGWLEAVLRKVNLVVDVGANDGYFAIGCAAAFRRLNKSGEIIAFEPEAQAFERLLSSTRRLQNKNISVSLHNCFVGAENTSNGMTLDEVARRQYGNRTPENALIKIDVEGAELDVIAGASSWLNCTNYFVIEVHWDVSFLTKLTRTFSERGMRLRKVDQQALPILGYEARGRDQWWLVSEPL